MTTYSSALDGTCWNILLGGLYQTVSLSLVPTFYHEGGVFRLNYFDQCNRDGPEVLYQNQKHGILLRIILDDTYFALFNGGNTLNWKGENGRTMTWSKTKCWIDTLGVPTTPLVNMS